MRETRGWAPGRQLYFAIRFSQPVLRTTSTTASPSPSSTAASKLPAPPPRTPNPSKAAASSPPLTSPHTSPLVVKVALSPVSEDAALANMQAEAPAFDFDAAHAAATAAWEKQFAALDLTAPPDLQRSLYTALYHSLLSPNLAMDTDGGYRGPDNQIHYAKGFHFVSNLSLWDTYRAEQPLMTLLQPPTRTADLVNSLLSSWRESPFGILPIWQEQGLETWCMIGYHAVPEIADALLKNIPGFDREEALRAMVASATYGPYGHLADYMRLGYVPVDHDDEAASKTMEYAFDDWTIARAAAALHHPDLAATFTQARQQLAQQLQPNRRLRRAPPRLRRLPHPLRPRQSRRRQRLHRGQRLAILLVPAPGRARPHPAPRRPGGPHPQA